MSRSSASFDAGKRDIRKTEKMVMRENQKTIDHVMTDGFDDAISKSVNDGGNARNRTLEMFSEVLGWDDKTIMIAVMLSIGEEAMEAAHFFTKDKTPEDHIKFIDGFAEQLKKQVRGRYEKS